MFFHKGYWIKSRIGMMACVKANAENVFIDLIQQSLEFRFKIHKACRMGVNADGETIVFRTHFGDLRDPVTIGGPFSLIHLFCLFGAAGCGGAARRDAVDDDQTRRAMGRKGFAGADRAIHDIFPGVGIVESTENYTANQLLVTFSQCLGQNGRIFGHKAYRAKLNARKARFGVLFEHMAPVGIARVIGELHTP